MRENATVPKENKMRTQPVGRLLFGMALPLALSMLVQAIYNVVDSIYVSRISESAVTALSLAFPVQNMLIGCGLGIGVGVNSLMSKSLGEGNRDHANLAAGNGAFLVVVMTACCVLFGLFGARPYFEMQSDVAQTVEGGTTYITICCLFSLGVMTEFLGERLLQASGRTVFTLFTQGTGAILNIVLDPVFIFGFAPLGIPAMGIAGAAVATVIGQWVAAAMSVFFNFKFNRDVQFALRYGKPNRAVMKMILAVGIPTAIMMAIGSVMNFGMNQIFLSFPEYGETPAAVFGVYFKLQSFVFMPVFGLNNATITLLAYNYGARLPERMLKTLRTAICSALCIMVLGTLIFQFLPEMLLAPFDPSESFLELGVVALRVVSLSFPMAAVGIVFSGCFQGLGIGIYSTVASLCRQLVVLVPAAWALSLTGAINSVWWAFPISEAVSLALSLLLFKRLYRKKIQPMRNV